MKISSVIITLNEARNIERCIRSVQGVSDEILVVDSCSTDGTQEIATQLGARVIEQEFLGHIEQKNFAKTHAQYDWILSLDADEALSEELQETILKVKQGTPDGKGYLMNRLTNYCGQWIRHSGWYPDRKLRFFEKEAGSWKGTNPHDRFVLDQGKPKLLKGDILHYSFYSTDEHLEQIHRFSTISAEAKKKQGVRSNWMKILFKPLFKFFKNYLIKLGFLDGHYGWLIARRSAYATYLKYSKLLKLQSND